MLTLAADDYVYRISWDPLQEWVDGLRAIDPIREAVSYLELLWHPRGRFMLYEMVPAYAIDADILAELQGFDPDVLPPYSTLITHRQWDLFQRTRRWARPCWVIQGTKGGHLFTYDEEHRQAAKIAHARNPAVPLRAPDVGSLPYAPWDERVARQIVRLSLLNKADGDIDRFRRMNTGDGAKREQQAMRKQYRAELVKWIGEQAEEPAEDFRRAFSTGEANDLPISDKDWEREDELATANFVERGRYSTH